MFVSVASVLFLNASLIYSADDEFITALTGKFPPFSYYNENGQLAGFDADVSREIAKRINKKSRIIATEWDGILAGLLAEKYDAIIGSMAITEERKKRVNFSIPYYQSGAQLFIHRDNPDTVYSIDECQGKRIAAVLGETYQHFLEKNYYLLQNYNFAVLHPTWHLNNP